MSLRSEIRLAFDRAPAPRRAAPSGLASELMAFDRASMRTFDIDGRLHVEDCNISKATVNPYYGREIPNSESLGLEPDKVYRLYRDPVELEKAAPTFARLQLLDTHVGVNPDDPKKEHICGTVGSDVRFEAPYLKASLAVWTSEAIKRILDKKQAQLSCSYRYDADMTPGVTPEGLTYDGRMINLTGNHVALVKEGRAGPEVCVNDSLPIGLNKMALKFPNIIATVAKVVTGLTDSQRTALDAAFEKAADAADPEEAMDSRECSMDEREEAMDESEKDEVAKGDRKKARDARKSARDARAADRKAKDKAKDSDPELETKEKELKDKGDKAKDSQIDLSQYVTAADAQRMAADASTAAVARVTAIDTARRDVAPLVGAIVVAMDSAEAVYRFALDHIKVAHKDVPAAALSHIVSAEVRTRKAAATPAQDAASVPGEFSLDSIFKVS